MKKFLESLALWLFPKTIERILERRLKDGRIIRYFFDSKEAYDECVRSIEEYITEERDRMVMEHKLYLEHLVEMCEAPDPMEENRIPDNYYGGIDPYEEEPEQIQDSAFLVDDGKPDVRIGDRVHLHTYRGMYTVYEVREEGFRIRTRNYTFPQLIPWKDFKCLAGGTWNLFRNEREPKD